jgi:hypothetical protein
MAFPGIWITVGTTLEEDRRPQGVEIEPNSQARGKNPGKTEIPNMQGIPQGYQGTGTTNIPGNPSIPSKHTPIVGNRPNSQFLGRDFSRFIEKIPSSPRKEK